ncbi:hypothetical protein AgCh_036188 [Apium graveolens]
MAKRTRIGSTSTLVDTNVTNYVISPANGGVVFCVEPLVNCESDRMGAFLEECFYCKKKLLFKMPVFMYSDRAFCTPECRGFQIMKDEPMVDEAKEKLNGKRKALD